MCLCLDAGIIHRKTCRVYQKLRPNRIPKHWNLPKRKPTLWRIRLMTCDGHFFWFLQRFCRHRENRKHRKRRKHTLYTPKKKISFFAYICIAVCWCRCFFQRLFLKEPTKQDEIQDVSEVCGLGLCAVYVGYFPFPRFYGYIELTPYIFMYIFSFLLVPGWHLECPHHLFFQNLPVQKVRYSKQKVCQNYLYIYIYT